jgi:hypothetical protein
MKMQRRYNSMRVSSFLLHTCALLLIALIPSRTYGDGSPLAPHLLKPEIYSEVYQAVLDLSEGVHIQVQLAISNIGIGDQNSMCSLLYIDNTESWNRERVFGRSGWSYEPPGNLKVGDCYISAGGGSASVYAEIDDAAVEVSFPGGLQAVQPPGHRIEAGKDFLDSQILIPWSKAEVRLDLDEQPERFVSGHGCMYHFWVTAWPNDIARKWVRVFGMNDDGAFTMMSRFPPEKDGEATGSIWAPGAPAPVAFDSLEIEASDEMIKTLSISSGGAVYRLVLQKELYRHAPMEEAGIFGRLISVFIGNWVTRTYQARLEVPGQDGRGHAIVEITADE